MALEQYWVDVIAASVMVVTIVGSAAWSIVSLIKTLMGTVEE